MMENNLKYFLCVADELSITRAAEKNYISQQSMSMHIKRLETSMNVKLFNRKPRFSLTPAGEILFETLNQIKILEDNLLLRLKEKNKETRGTIVVGISHSRANIIMPEVMRIYKKKWPKIEIILQQDSTSENLESRIIRGYLDFFIGVGEISDNENIESKLLHNENLYFIVPRQLIETYCANIAPESQYNESVDIDLSIFKDIPFISDTSNELSAKIYSRYFEKNDLQFATIFKCDNAELRSSLCINNIGTTVLVGMMLQFIKNYNLTSENNKLIIYPLKGLHVPSIVAYHKNKFLTAYAKEFIDIAIKISKERYEIIKNIGADQDRLKC